MKKILTLIAVLSVIILAGCNPLHYYEPHEKPLINQPDIWEKNETHHWLICDVGGEKIFENLHHFSDWIIVTEPSESSEGIIERHCKTCGYTETAILKK